MDYTIFVKKLHKDAIIPKRMTQYSAGYDLYALESGCIEGNKKQVLRTGIAINIPSNCFANIRSRSSLSFYNNIEGGAGVIDADYSNEIKVILYNHSPHLFHYKAGDRIAQLIVQPYVGINVQEVEKLPSVLSNRLGGFGSTGK